ncbi:TPA: hypothetical protein PXJ35_002804 [Yersinia enterocolitica]|nr:hypothetical protein [Yersinia enterocolitica]HDL6654536.1 hypothetical protein [Yersinia enterocolitica]HDL6680653.1 hypothetical protein [Yersinia enterocolitica]
MKNRLTVKDFKNKDSFFFYAVSLITCQERIDEISSYYDGNRTDSLSNAVLLKLLINNIVMYIFNNFENMVETYGYNENLDEVDLDQVIEKLCIILKEKISEGLV